MQPQAPHQIFFLFYCEEMREPVLSVSACVEQDEQDNTTMALFQIFDSVIHWIRKKNNADSKQSLNSTQNSWTRYRSNNTSFFIVSLSDCRLIVISVRHCESRSDVAIQNTQIVILRLRLWITVWVCMRFIGKPSRGWKSKIHNRKKHFFDLNLSVPV